MKADQPERQLLPIACTLGPSEGMRRLDDWRQVVSIASVGRHLADGRLTLRFRDEPTVAEVLARLVAAERSCCAFLGWRLARVDNEWHVEITGDDAELQALSLG
jgi:hypothetical protein